MATDKKHIKTVYDPSKARELRIYEDGEKYTAEVWDCPKTFEFVARKDYPKDENSVEDILKRNGFVDVSPDYDKGYEDGFEDGHNAGESDTIDRQETISVLIYLINRFDYNECYKYLAGMDEPLARHIWSKFEQFCNKAGSREGAVAAFILEIDKDLAENVIRRATELYRGRKSRAK